MLDKARELTIAEVDQVTRVGKQAIPGSIKEVEPGVAAVDRAGQQGAGGGIQPLQVPVAVRSHQQIRSHRNHA